MSRLGSILTKPIGWPTFVVFGAVMLWFLWLGIYPGIYYLAGPILSVFLLAAVGIWLVFRVGIARVLNRVYSKDEANRKNEWQRWGYLALMIVVTMTLIRFQVPMRLGFMTIRRPMHEIADDLTPGGEVQIDSDFGTRLYRFSGECTIVLSSEDPLCLIFVFADDHEAAFVYCPSGIENVPTTGAKGHLTGHWYWRKDD